VQSKPTLYVLKMPYNQNVASVFGPPYRSVAKYNVSMMKS